MSQKTYTTGEAANLLGVHVNTMRQWCDQGKIQAHRTSAPIGHWRITRSVLVAYAQKNGIPLQEEGNGEE